MNTVTDVAELRGKLASSVFLAANRPCSLTEREVAAVPVDILMPSSARALNSINQSINEISIAPPTKRGRRLLTM